MSASDGNQMTIKINLGRLDKDLTELGKIGATPEGGVSRRPFSPEDRQGRSFVIEKMKEAGLETWMDPGGNIHGRRSGKNLNGPTVATGSHADTVENGGRFDGALGVMGAIEALRALNEAGIETDSNLEVISFLAEEPSRFNTTSFGSKLLAGKLRDPRILDFSDQTGLNLGHALREMDIDPAKIFAAKYSPGQMAAFVELHVEQGPILYANQLPIGIVTDIVCGYRYRVEFEGQADHSGATPMDRRKDALAAASEAILAVEQIGRKYSSKDIVATVGVIRSTPSMLNVVPGYAEILIDIRGRVHFPKTKPAQEIREAILEIGRRRKIEAHIHTLMEEESPALSENIIQVIRQCAIRRSYPYLLMPSRAGHDAMNLVDLTSVGMIFVPSKDGISHNPGEWTAAEDMGKGVSLLADTLLALATLG